MHSPQYRNLQICGYGAPIKMAMHHFVGTGVFVFAFSNWTVRKYKINTIFLFNRKNVLSE